ncbi:hypothetical protein [[Mycobacterium] crassicus]|uniref:Uncharacterized protein n=1 Tax=[Mycobacterium] crassicus TaxID=2872309 RepID=A0ABU5XJ37_9MYCO|nr:hypothetical protein [Mycolicibacter sp. MYC098]MEB3021332.1 hypothetical protein [Mycolicibacter sp. MYC098]
MTVNDDATQEAPAGSTPPTTEIDPAPTVADGPLAYSEHTSSMPVVDYESSRLRPTWIIALVLAAAAAVATATFVLGRTTAPPQDDEMAPTDSWSTDSATVPTAQKPYDGTVYADHVKTAILSNFFVDSFPAACPMPDWVCAIDHISSPRPGVIDVTLRSDWDTVLLDSNWHGPPAGIGCMKWGERISRNVINFTRAAKVTPPSRVAVYVADGSLC